MMTELFTPAKIGNCEIPNRLIVPAMVMNLCTEDGMITERYIKYIEEKAKGGWGMVITEDYAVNVNAKGYKFIPGFDKEMNVFIGLDGLRYGNDYIIYLLENGKL